ncbi:E3 ubiquitin-protein ligase TRIM17-like [Trichomycterus rosablanca]|uniref:E3 ubiquitin-protein ligase TRIM17-like n=1 Tax=Trichomycterus rosablanca TaxID=2290929 RepID=UPI002F350F37
MASSHSDVEENLKCSICLDFFTDPVVLSCSHSFCTSCINRNWNESEARKCPLCRKKSRHAPCKSLVIREISEVVVKKRRVLNEEEVCGVHDQEFLQDQTLEIEKQIRDEFKKLRQFLKEEENARIAALKQEEQEKRVRITVKMNETSET